MKTNLFLTLIAGLFVSSSLMAQFHIGFKGGANVTKITGHSFKDKFSYGYHLGGFAEIGFPFSSIFQSYPKPASASISL